MLLVYVDVASEKQRQQLRTMLRHVRRYNNQPNGHFLGESQIFIGSGMTYRNGFSLGGSSCWYYTSASRKFLHRLCMYI